MANSTTTGKDTQPESVTQAESLAALPPPPSANGATILTRTERELWRVSEANSRYWQRRCSTTEDELADARNRCAVYRQALYASWLLAADPGMRPGEVPQPGVLSPDVELLAPQAVQALRQAYDQAAGHR